MASPALYSLHSAVPAPPQRPQQVLPASHQLIGHGAVSVLPSPPLAALRMTVDRSNPAAGANVVPWPPSLPQFLAPPLPPPPPPPPPPMPLLPPPPPPPPRQQKPGQLPFASMAAPYRSPCSQMPAFCGQVNPAYLVPAVQDINTSGIGAWYSADPQAGRYVGPAAQQHRDLADQENHSLIQQQHVSSSHAHSGSNRAVHLGTHNYQVYDAAGVDPSLQHESSNVTELTFRTLLQPTAADYLASIPANIYSPVDTLQEAPPVTAVAFQNELGWSQTMQLIDPDKQTPTGQQLLLSDWETIGSSSSFLVKKVRVKLYGRNSLSAMAPKNTALSLLLQRTPCSCRPLVTSQSSHGVDAVSGIHDSCTCGVWMATKLPKWYHSLPNAVRQRFATTDEYVRDQENRLLRE